MKHLLILSATFLLSTSVFAASPALLTALINSEIVASMQGIDKVEVTATARCRECYEIEITGKNYTEKKDVFVKVISKYTPTGITFTVIE